jgi:Domain of unknown function (DUF4190)
VAIESNAPAVEADAPIIENEFPAYRAISPMAVISLILGLVSILSFADFSFLLAALAAIVTGALAARKIHRMPEVLTGRGFAHAGIALGLAFSLAAVSVDTVQGFIRRREAMKFARDYAEALRSGNMAQALWFGAPINSRREMSPDQILERMERESRRDPGTLVQQTTPVKEVQKRLAASPSATLTIEGIERDGVDGLDPYALVLFRLRGPGNAEQNIAPHDDYAMAVLKGKVTNRKYEWLTDSLTYPYKPKSHVMKTLPIDDGHGHAH